MDKTKLHAAGENLREESKLLVELLEIVGDEAPAEFKTPMMEMATQANNVAVQIENFAGGNIPVKVALVGDFASGKSSFINSILEYDNLCPQRADPTTSFVTTFTYGTNEEIFQQRVNEKPTKLTRKEYVQRVQGGGKPSKTRGVVRFIYHLPSNLLKGCELLDTPGFNNPKNPADSEVTVGIMQEADALLYLLDASKGALTKTDIEKLKRIRQEATEAVIFLVISKADLQAPAALVRITTWCQEKHRELFDEPILTYTTEAARPDIATRDDIAQLFGRIQKDRMHILRGSLARRVRSHLDLRLTIGAKLDFAIKDLGRRCEAEIRGRTAKWKTTERRLEELAEEESKRLWRELAETLDETVTVREIAKSGWFYNDARITYKRQAFGDAMRGFDSLELIEVGLKAFTRSLFAYDIEIKSEAFDEAKEKSVASADEYIRANVLAENSQRFDSSSDANEALSAAWDKHLETLFDAAWEPWRELIGGIWGYLESEYVEEHNAVLGERRSRLEDGTATWNAIRDRGEQISK